MVAQVQGVVDSEADAATQKSPETTVQVNLEDQSENSYRPTKWQSHVTILSCVCLYSRHSTLAVH